MFEQRAKESSYDLPIEYRPEYDVLVVGAGIAGLIVARQCLSNGYKVHLIEAKSTIGGRICSRVVTDYLDTTDNAIPIHLHDELKKKLSETDVIELGSEWYDDQYHINVNSEMSRYSLEYEEDSCYNNRSCWSYKSGLSLGTEDIPIPLQSTVDHNEYKRVMLILEEHLNKVRSDLDSRRVRKLSGYSSEELEQFDVSFVEYIDKYFATFGVVRDFLMTKSFMMMGASPDEFSALDFLELLTRHAGRFGSLHSAMFRRAKRIKGGSSRLIDAVYNDIRSFGTDRITITMNVSLTSVSSLQAPPNVSAPIWRTDLLTPKPISQALLSDGTSIKIKNLVVATPLNVLQAIRFTPALPSCLAFASSKCQVGKYLKVWVIATGVSLDVDSVCTYPAACIFSQVKYRIKLEDVKADSNRDSPINYRNASKKTDVHKEEITILQASGMIQDMFKLPLQKNRYGDSSYMSVDKLDASAQCEQIEAHLLKHHPTIKVHQVIIYDYYNDVYSRGTALAIKKGMKHIHKQVCETATKAWQSDTGNILSFAGSDYNDEFSSCVEGAIRSAHKCADSIAKYLSPPRREENWMKRIPPPSL